MPRWIVETTKDDIYLVDAKNKEKAMYAVADDYGQSNLPEDMTAHEFVEFEKGLQRKGITQLTR